MTLRKSTGIRKHTFRTAYETGDNNIYQISATDGITEQHHSESCDINKILAQFMQTGIMPNTNNDPQYGDASDPNLQFAAGMNLIAKAKSLFEELPQDVRERFDNEPYKFMKFAQDENNMTEMVKMGLANAPIPIPAPDGEDGMTQLPPSILKDEDLPNPDETK